MSFPAGLRHIPDGALAVSEPSPSMFGNGANPTNNKAWTNGNWLKSRFHFSFAEYNNPRNGQFGVLRVLNDDLVQPDRGFGTHPHGDIEIATYIVRGGLTHKDSMGSAETLQRGAIQFMSAGTGVRHSEYNKATDADLRFIQMWIVPRTRGLKPSYGGYQGTLEQRQNQFQHIVSDADAATPKDTPVKVHQDVNIHVAEVDAGKSVSMRVDEGRQAYAVVLEGTDVAASATDAVLGLPIRGAEEPRPVASVTTNAHSAFEIYGGNTGTTLSFSASAVDNAHVLVIEMAQDSRGGRSDL